MPAESTAGYTDPIQEIEYVRTYTKVAQVQLRAVIDALAEQVDRLGDLPVARTDRPDATASTTPYRPGAPRLHGLRAGLWRPQLTRRVTDWAWMAVMATVFTMSSTVQPRERSLTGLRRPCRTGPTATAPEDCCTAL